MHSNRSPIRLAYQAVSVSQLVIVTVTVCISFFLSKRRSAECIPRPIRRTKPPPLSVLGGAPRRTNGLRYLRWGGRAMNTNRVSYFSTTTHTENGATPQRQVRVLLGGVECLDNKLGKFTIFRIG